MAKLTRQLLKLAKGGNEEWWRLVFDTEAQRFILSTNGAIRTRGEPPVQRAGLRSLISMVSWPRVKRLLKQSCSELSRACSKMGAARMPKAPKAKSAPDRLTRRSSRFLQHR